MTDREILGIYLSPPFVQPNGWTIKSSMWAALIDARNSTGRDELTGQIEDPEGSRSWIGAMGYLSLLDQIGTAVARPSRANSLHTNGLQRALLAFTNLTDDERDAVIALRNAFAHDYSLISIDRRPGKTGRHHRFQLSHFPGALVVIPQNRWSGDLANLDGEDTYMSLREVANLVEDVTAEARRCYDANDVEIGLAAGAPEMQARYFLTYQEPPT